MYTCRYWSISDSPSRRASMIEMKEYCLKDIRYFATSTAYP